MWLLKLHFSISVLCLLTFIGFRAVYKQQIKDNGWGNDDEKKKRITGLSFFFFVPIMNILLVIVLFMMIGVKKKDYDKMCEETKRDNEGINS